TFSAQLSAELGLPYAFASHFAPNHLYEALQLYRDGFKSSEQIGQSYAMAAVNVVVADTDEEAEYLASSMKQFMLSVIRNTRQPLPPPVKSMSQIWNPMEEAHITQMMQYSFVGSKETVQREMDNFVDKTGVD